MSPKKLVISLFLLFTYTLGFTHDLIPHSHLGDDALHSTTEQHYDHHNKNHHDHQHGHHGEMNLEHIVHADHMDDGLIEYLMCVLGESHHGTTQNDRCFYTIANVKDILKIRRAKDSFTTLMFALNADLNDNTLSGIINPEVKVAYHPPPILRAPNRGPPSSSC